MKWFLARHCEAEAGEHLDPERTLTKKGEAQIPVIGDFLLSQTDKISTVVCSSDLKRGIDTGEGLAEHLDADLIQTPLVDPPSNGPDVPRKDIDALYKFVKKTVKDAEGEVLVVAHGPMVEAFAAFLLGTDQFDFSHGSVMRIEDVPGKTVLHWFITPKAMLRAMERDEDAAIDEALRIEAAMMPLKFDEATGEYYYEETLLKRSVLGDGGVAGNCDACDDSADQGWIDSEDVFESGEDEPPHHPNCTCTVEYKESRKRVYV